MSEFGDWLSGVEAAITGYKPPPPPPLAPSKKVEIPNAPSSISSLKPQGLLDSTTAPVVPPQPIVLNKEVWAGCKRMRIILVESGYSAYVSDAVVEHIVTMVLIDAAKARLGVS